MKDFYNNYEGVSYANMAKEVDEACNCIAANPCSSLASEVDSISTSMQSVSAECQSLWEDVVETNFSEYVTSIVDVFKEITSSINSSFSKAESLYKTLKELLEQLKSKNDSYQSEYKSKPSETIASNENNLDGTVRYVPNPAYTTWQNKVKNLEVECKGIISQIKKTSNELMAINGETVAASVVAGGAGGISVPTFEMPEIETVVPENNVSNEANENVEVQTSSTVVTSNGSYEENCSAIKKYLKSQGLTEAGVAGLMGNLYAESSMYTNNMQDSYEGRFNDSSYTASIDNGSYSRKSFINDKIGYGLAQWTYSSRKEGLYDYCKQKGTSISDIQSQLEYLVKELKTNYSKVWKTLCNSNDLRECTRIVLYDFENPASKNLNTRLSNAKKYLN